MATEQSSVLEHSEWRAIQKERERERRRMRDRQRRQSMTSEEREKHLARRRRNYQLRRQRAANAQSGFQFQPQKLNNLINPHEKTTSQAAKNESFALVCVSEEPPASSQPDHGTQLAASNEANHVQNAPAVKYHNSMFLQFITFLEYYLPSFPFPSFHICYLDTFFYSFFLLVTF